MWKTNWESVTALRRYSADTWFNAMWYAGLDPGIANRKKTLMESGETKMEAGV